VTDSHAHWLHERGKFPRPGPVEWVSAAYTAAYREDALPRSCFSGSTIEGRAPALNPGLPLDLPACVVVTLRVGSVGLRALYVLAWLITRIVVVVVVVVVVLQLSWHTLEPQPSPSVAARVTAPTMCAIDLLLFCRSLWPRHRCASSSVVVCCSYSSAVGFCAVVCGSSCHQVV
jgi:hypothetical protein